MNPNSLSFSSRSVLEIAKTVISAFDKYFHYLFVFAVVGVLSLSLSNFHSHDEGAHTARAFAMSQGKIFETDPYNMLPVQLDLQFENKVLTKDDFPMLPDKTFGAYNDDKTLGNLPLNDTSYGSVLIGTDTTNNYSSLLYLPAAIGFKVASTLNATSNQGYQIAKWFNFLTYLFMVLFAIRLFKGRRFKYFLATVAVMPSILGGALIISADTLHNAFTIFYLGALLNIITQNTVLQNTISKGRKLDEQQAKIPSTNLKILIIASILISFTKMNDIILLFPLLFISYQSISKKKSMQTILKVLPFALTVAMYCFMKLMGLQNGAQTEEAKYLFTSNSNFYITHLKDYLKILIFHSDIFLLHPFDSFGQMPLGDVFAALFIAVLLAVIIISEPIIDRRSSIILVVSTALFILLTNVIFVFSAGVGYGVPLYGLQPRYFSFVTPIVLYCIVSLIKNYRAENSTSKKAVKNI